MQIPKYFYHVTDNQNLGPIQEVELIPTLGPRTCQISDQKCIYLFSSQLAAEDAITNWFGDLFSPETELVLLRIESANIVNPIPTFRDNDSWEWTTTHLIPNTAITISKDPF